MQTLYRFTERSLLLRLGFAMAAITLLGIIGMASSIIIAGKTQGNAETIDIAGSLRMQSYRMASLILVAQRQNSTQGWDAVDTEITRFENTLKDDKLHINNILSKESSINLEYEELTREWQSRLRPGLTELTKQGRDALRHTQLKPVSVQTDLDLLHDISLFVDKIDNLVKLLAHESESRVVLLSTILGISLYITLAVVLFTMYVMHADVLLPLRNLLTCAEMAGKGDFSVRAQHTGEDELGRLGNAFNAMAEDLSKLYRNLEERVAAKTLDLERSNRSLELLYHSITRIYDAPIAPNTYLTLLKDLDKVLGLGSGTACLIENDSRQATVLASTLLATEGNNILCGLNNCGDCLNAETVGLRQVGKQGDTRILSIPLQDMERQYGIMQMEIPLGKTLEDWQTQLLEALSRHIGIAIGSARRTEQNRRLSLLEERGAIARELHDSLAQSLSYMKIQVSRLQAAMAPNPVENDTAVILSELREGMNAAYRELRELLTTFRLKIEGNGLIPTLEKIAAEFSARGQIPISIESSLDRSLLSANEEIHVMQIVREALANIIHHAKARHASISIEAGADDIISVTIDDDGIGLENGHAEMHHYGMSIMRERTRSLGGTFQALKRATGGTRISFTFQAGDRRSSQPLQQGT